MVRYESIREQTAQLMRTVQSRIIYSIVYEYNIITALC